MNRTLPLLLALALPLSGCMAIGPAVETAWGLRKIGAKIVGVVDVLVPDKDEPEPEETDDGGDA